MLTFEEAGFAKQTATGATSIMVAASPDSDESLPNSSSHSYHSGGVKKGQNCHYHNNKKSSGSKGGKGGGHDGGGGQGGLWNGGQANRQQQQGPGPIGWQQQWGSASGPWPWQWPWKFPLRPYPTTNWARPNTLGRQPTMYPCPRVLGSRPQAYQAAASGQPTTTDIEAVMYTLCLNVLDANWYMDTRATSHMTSVQGNLSLILI